MAQGSQDGEQAGPLIYAGARHARPVDGGPSEAEVAAFRANPDARILVYWRGRFAFRHGTDPLPVPISTLFAGLTPPPTDLQRSELLQLYLGQFDGAPLFAVDLSGLPGQLRPDGTETGPAFGMGEKYRDLRGIAATLEAGMTGALAHAQALFLWHRDHGFCARCGEKSFADPAGRTRRCNGPQGCGAQHFPRVNPVAIMLVTDKAGERILLGRPHHLPPGLYSCLAGFVEPAETLEAAVIRETQEEAGVRIDPDSLDYVASQPWPWPGNIMCAFIGRALADELDPDLDELEDVAWFTREQVAAMGELGDPDRPETEPKLPRRDAVARHLILRWLHG